MAADKDQMLKSANYYAGLVAAAKNACSEAKSSLGTAQNTVANSWTGESGDAMSQVLLDLATEIGTIQSELAALESEMRAHAQSIYNNWPEEEISDS